MADDGEDGDLKLVKASTGLINDIYRSLDVVLWKTANHSQDKTVHRFARELDLTRLITKIDPFQQDPQLLDPHLSFFVHQLSTCYLDALTNHGHLQECSVKPGCIAISSAISTILYFFCKIRGEKIIVGLLTNEPRWLRPLLESLEWATFTHKHDASWEERYILLLWLSHLLLTPFDLEVIISDLDPGATVAYDGIHLATDLPAGPRRLIPIVLSYLDSSTREQKAAVLLLVRLVLRPDMQAIHLVDLMTRHSLTTISHTSPPSSLSLVLGHLTFLTRLLATGTNQELASHVPAIFDLARNVLENHKFLPLRASAVVRKLVIKSTRNIALMTLRTPINAFDTGTALEETIGSLLDMLGDGDTPVRIAASKSISLLTMQLGSDVGADVVDAVLASLKEDTLSSADVRDFSAVNPLRWHGLVLTLSHLLFRRALPAHRLPDLLNALMWALNFYQTSPIGTSIGTNVRDAANFGIWSIARRYTTLEMEKVNTMQIRACSDSATMMIPTVLHKIALALLASACTDPAGNIRRGSSAALQELIGRHPDCVPAGISLVQLVDYQAVGLDASAMQRGVKASGLHLSYWETIFWALQGWRGLESPHAARRISAAESIAQLGMTPGGMSVEDILHQLYTTLLNLPFARVVERHGLIMSISKIIKHRSSAWRDAQPSTIDANSITTFKEQLQNMITQIQKMLPDDFNYYHSPMLQPDLTASATLELVDALCEALRSVDTAGRNYIHYEYLQQRINWCLLRRHQSVLNLVPCAIRSLLLLIPDAQEMTIQSWLRNIKHDTELICKSPGLALALGAAASLLYKRGVNVSPILEILKKTSCMATDMEGRALALKALGHVLPIHGSSTTHEPSILHSVAETIYTCLNDVTTNDRGDVGSMVRIEALKVTVDLWHSSMTLSKALEHSIYCAVVRLALEKLDRVRLTASKTLSADPRSKYAISRLEETRLTKSTKIDSHDAAIEVDSSHYFDPFLEQLLLSTNVELQESIVQGYCSSAGSGSESVLQASRTSLKNWMLTGDCRAQKRAHMFLTTLMAVMNKNNTTERVIVPCLETLAFLGDYGIFSILSSSEPPIK